MSVAQFATLELQILDVGSESVSGKFEHPDSRKAFDCLVENDGLSGAYVVFSEEEIEAKNYKSDVSGTRTTYIPAGKGVVIDIGPAIHFAGRTDEGTTRLYLHAGKDM